MHISNGQGLGPQNPSYEGWGVSLDFIKHLWKAIMETILIAPCGMNCALCAAFQREKNKCSGCLTTDNHKSNHCLNCRIKLCEHHNLEQSVFCYDCTKFPCFRIKQIDKRYRTKYRMSMIENLNFIQNSGLDEFVSNEEIKWSCPECGGMLCVHKDYCLGCEKEKKGNNYFTIKIWFW